MTVVHIVVAMKPLEGNYAENAISNGVAGLNVDGCRVGTEKRVNPPAGPRGTGKFGDGGEWDRQQEEQETTGRFPANLIHDGSEQVVGLFPETASGKMKPTHTDAARAVYGQNAAGGYMTMETYGDTGSASRFFKECKV